jgi:predicted enzyme related to lactoylglutathione lyase
MAAFYRDVIGVELGPGDDEATHFEAYWGDWGPDSTDPFFFFAIQPLAAGAPPTTGVEIGFDVPDLDAAHARVTAAGVTVVEAPVAKGWGRAASYLDPQGNTVQLSEP